MYLSLCTPLGHLGPHCRLEPPESRRFSVSLMEPQIKIRGWRKGVPPSLASATPVPQFFPRPGPGSAQTDPAPGQARSPGACDSAPLVSGLGSHEMRLSRSFQPREDPASFNSPQHANPCYPAARSPPGWLQREARCGTSALARSQRQATLPYSCPVAGAAAPETLTRLRLGCKDEFGEHWGIATLALRWGI